MSEEVLYERYKNALKTGHIAAVQGHLQAALDAYADAAEVAPDRPLPHASLGRVLFRLDRAEEALEAYARALRCAPHDETALSGRAEVLSAVGRRVEAAGVLDLLAEVQEQAGRIPDACDTARRALELAESRARRRYLEGLVGELRRIAPAFGGEAQLARALRVLEGPALAPEPGVERSEGPADNVAAAGPAAESAEMAPAAESAGMGPTAESAVAGPAAEGAPESAEEEAPDIGALLVALDAAIESGDPARVHDAVLVAADRFRRAGLLEAALDVCHQALTVAPADPAIHLALAELDLDHGWMDAATDKLLILSRYLDLVGDAESRRLLCDLVAARHLDDQRLAATCA